MKKKRCRAAALCVLSAACLTVTGTGGSVMQAAAAWKQVRADWQFYDENGRQAVGWVKDADGSWYYIDPASGMMKTGWMKAADGTWYFLNPISNGTKGKMMQGWQWIDGYCYYFGTSEGASAGRMFAGGKTPDGYLVNADGKWTDDKGVVQYVKGKGISAAGNAAAVISSSGGSSSGGTVKPGKPSVPSEPENPTMPEEPENPTKPVEPEKPATPSEPEKPTKPIEPEEPEKPTKPVEPEEPEKPTTPVEPEKPATPSEPEKPATPSEPEKPATPSEPEKPERTVKAWKRFETITVAYGTPEEEVREQLPQTVALTLSDGELVEEDIVDWIGDIDTSNGGATYRLTAEYLLPFDVGGKKPEVFIRIKIGEKPEEVLPAEMSLEADKESYYYQENPILTIKNYDGNSAVSIEKPGFFGSTELEEGTDYLFDGQSGTIKLISAELVDGDYDDPEYLYDPEDAELTITVGEKTFDITVHYNANPKLTVDDEDALENLPREEEVELDIRTSNVKDEELDNLQFFAGEADAPIEGTYFTYNNYFPTLHIPYDSLADLLDAAGSVTITAKLEHAKDLIFTLQFKVANQFDIMPDKTDGYYYQEDTVLSVLEMTADAEIKITQKAQYSWESDKVLAKGTDYTADYSAKTITLHTDQIFSRAFGTETTIEYLVQMNEKTAAVDVIYKKKKQLTFSSDSEAAWTDLIRGRSAKIRVLLDSATASEDQKALKLYAGETELNGFSFEEKTGQWGMKSVYISIPFEVLNPYLDENGEITITGKLFGADKQTAILRYRTGEAAKLSLSSDKKEYYYSENPRLTIENYDGTAEVTVFRIKPDGKEELLTEDIQYRLDAETGEIKLNSGSIFREEEQKTAQTASFGVTVGGEKLSAAELTFKLPEQGEAIAAEVYLEDPADVSSNPKGYPLVTYGQYQYIRLDFTGEAFTEAFLKENLTVEIQSDGEDRFKVPGADSYADTAWYITQNNVDGKKVTSIMLPVEQPDENGMERIHYKKKADGRSPVTDIYLNMPGYGEKKLSVVVTAF